MARGRPKSAPEYHAFSARITIPIYKRVKAAAEEEGVTFVEWFRRAVMERLDEKLPQPSDLSFECSHCAACAGEGSGALPVHTCAKVGSEF